MVLRRSHACPYTGCPTRIGRQDIACSRHWVEVPHDLQDDVWRTFRAAPGSDAHRVAVLQVVGYLARLAGLRAQQTVRS
jgi:hypothetical protein